MDRARFEEARDLLDDLGDSCSESAVFRLRLAWLEMRQGRHESAARRFIEIVRQWPLDPAAFNNGIVSLMALGKWDTAQRLFNAAPPSLRRLKHFDLMKSRLETRNIATGELLVREPFYGQPDLGGLLTPRKPQIEQNVPTANE